MRIGKNIPRNRKRSIASERINEAQKLVKRWTDAERGDVGALNYLGNLYEKGVEVLKDYEEAFRWFQKSAELGDTYAQIKLGEFYFNGLGVEPDIIQAYTWFNIAAENGIRSSVQRRDFLEKSMTPDQINEAQRLSKKWAEKNKMPKVFGRLARREKEKKSSFPEPRENELAPRQAQNVTPSILSDGWNPSGSGFYLKGTTHILTNLHVVGIANNIRASFPSGEIYYGEIIARDANNDVAIIALKGMSPRDNGFHVSLDVDFDPGMRVHAIGFPMGSKINIVSGHISPSNGIDRNITRFTMTAPISEGNSGGPVIDENANLIGIAQGGLVQRRAEDVRFGTKISTTIHALEAAQLTRQFSVQAIGEHRKFSPREIFQKFAPYVVRIDVKEPEIKFL